MIKGVELKETKQDSKKPGKKLSKEAIKKQKYIITIVAAINLLKIAIVIAFFIYLYFWIKARS